MMLIQEVIVKQALSQVSYEPKVRTEPPPPEPPKGSRRQEDAVR
jgi:hypothetical protein